MTKAFEVNFDGIVGPTHNYGGLAYGNIASIRHGYSLSNPRAAVLEGLAKMKFLADLGLKQAVLPPHERPDLQTARKLGFTGSDSEIVQKLSKEDPLLLASLYSSSSMWVANAATVSPSPDTQDRRVHFTPANLVSQFHRSLEPHFTGEILRIIFKDQQAFAHHHPLPGSFNFSDEGAANHTRLSASYGGPGVELFAYGREAFMRSGVGPAVYPARQSLEASKAIARLHKLDARYTIFAKHNPDAIDSGVFHNDVISVGNRNVFLYHSSAFAESSKVLAQLQRGFADLCQEELVLIEARPEELSIEEAVQTYVFNSQLVSLSDDAMCLIAPTECRENARTKNALDRIVAEDNPIRNVYFVDVRQSMKNGGGPACLRLRVVLTEEEIAMVHQRVFLTDRLYEELVEWAQNHYREQLHLKELADPNLIRESRTALDELARILQLGSVYGFQRHGSDLSD